MRNQFFDHCTSCIIFLVFTILDIFFSSFVQVGNIAIKPSDIQDTKKTQYFSQQPQLPQQQQQQQYSVQRPMYSIQTHIHPQTVYAAYNRPQPQLPAAAYHNLNGINGCLPENARCEKGHDEQCCGSQSYCVNYWGSGKCVAFKPTDKADRTNPYTMLANLNAKTNFNAMLNQVKNELSAYSYHRKAGDVLKINDIY